MNHFIAHNMPKVELHCHLDGSMSAELVQKLLRNQGEEYSIEQLQELLTAPRDCGSLAEYLKRFDLPLKCLQTREGLSLAAEELALSAAKEHVRYIEVRFAPAFSTAQGLSYSEVIESVNSGLVRAGEKTDILAGIIVCTMRNIDAETNIAMLKSAREFFGSGVVGCDLAGDEKAYPTADFADVFAFAKKYEFPFTIHAGECKSAESVKAAIELGAKRIGHGIAMSGNNEIKKLCAEKKIGVELCPTSNLQTKAVTDFSQYPFMEFYKAGIPLSVNTDNRTVSGTTCTDEYMRLAEAGMFNVEMYEKIYHDSVASAFASDELKNKIMGLF
jgi:adenosine deaminase